ncbi:MAG: hypothetical protein JSR85_00135 [Proteobacteria bacterium]|nr:hypothetical protein [Pseudomonadota bacterium]
MVSSLALMDVASAGGGPWKQALKEQKEDIGALTQRCIRAIEEIDESSGAPTGKELDKRTAFKKQRWEARLKKCLTLREKLLLEPQDYLDIALVDQEFLPILVPPVASLAPEPTSHSVIGKTLKPLSIPEETASSSHTSSIMRLDEERSELSEFLSKKNYPKAFDDMKATTVASDEEIVKFLLSSNGYGKWADLLPETQQWVIVNIKGAAQRKELEETLAQKDYAGAFSKMKETTDASEERIVKFLLSSNGYGKWTDLLPETQQWVVAKVKDAAQRKELEELLSQKDYAGAFNKMRETTDASEEGIVKFLLSSNGYGRWEGLLPETQEWVVDKVKQGRKIAPPPSLLTIVYGGRSEDDVRHNIDTETTRAAECITNFLNGKGLQCNKRLKQKEKRKNKR